MDNAESITLVRDDSKFQTKFRMEIKKDLVGVGKDYVVVELNEDALMQLGKLAMDMANSETIKELRLTL